MGLSCSLRLFVMIGVAKRVGPIDGSDSRHIWGKQTRTGRIIPETMASEPQGIANVRIDIR